MSIINLIFTIHVLILHLKMQAQYEGININRYLTTHYQDGLLYKSILTHVHCSLATSSSFREGSGPGPKALGTRLVQWGFPVYLNIYNSPFSIHLHDQSHKV